MREFYRNHFVFVLIAGLLIGLPGCGGATNDLPKASIPGNGESPGGSPVANTADSNPVQVPANPQDSMSPATTHAETQPEVLVETSLGDIRLRLHAQEAPRTVENFLYNYAERGFYDGTVIHYVESGYLVAAGGYTTDLKSKETRTPILCEADNGLSNRRGTVAMARHPDYPHSATSQFFINLADNTELDNQPTEEGAANGYCVFGEVVEGMEVVDRIAAAPVHDEGEFVKTPVEKLVIKSVRRLR